MKKAIKLLLPLLLIILLRGPLYRLCVHYTAIGERPLQAVTSYDLLHQIEQETSGIAPDIRHIIRCARHITNQRLSFTFGSAPTSPNELVLGSQAHCVGYAAFFAAVADHLIQEQGLADRYEVSHLVGRLDFLGIDLHQFSDDPFFRDHDFVLITDRQNGTTIAIDPSISDIFGIHRISTRN